MLNTCSIGRRWKSREGWSRPVLTGERGTLFPTLAGRVSSCGGFLVGWQGTLFLVVTTTILVRRLICLRPLSGSRTATTGIGRVAGSVAGRSRLGVGRLEWFCGGHGPGETPGPFPNPEAKAWHGDGTALERVWESSAPPHSTLGVPVERNAPGTPFFMLCCAGPPAGARCPGCRAGLSRSRSARSVSGFQREFFVIPQRLLVNRYFFRNVLLTRYMIRFAEYGLWNGIGKDGNDVPEHRSAACTM